MVRRRLKKSIHPKPGEWIQVPQALTYHMLPANTHITPITSRAVSKTEGTEEIGKEVSPIYHSIAVSELQNPKESGGKLSQNGIKGKEREGVH